MRTLKLNWTWWLLALAGLSTFPIPAPSATSTPSARHSLWKVQGEHAAVYLLGSIHVLKKEDYPLPAPIESAFTNASVAAFETDMEAMQDPKVALTLATKGRLPAGETLRDHLSPEVYASLTNHLRTAGLARGMFDQLTPVMAALSLVLMEMQRLGLDPEYGVDKHFFARARADGKQIVALETVDFQIGLLTDMSKEEGELIVKTTLRDMEKLESDLGDLLKAWRTGDAEQLDKFLHEAMREAPLIYQRLITDRNRNWISRLEELLRGDKRAIVIVGAGHLVGKEGILELLKQKGYKATQE